jgi:hypothetical protein
MDLDLVTGRKREREMESQCYIQDMDRKFGIIKDHFDALKKDNEILTKKLLTQKAAMAAVEGMAEMEGMARKEEMLKELRTTVKRID